MPMDWGFAEAMAIGSLVLEGIPVSSERTGFGPRHIFAASRVDVRHDDRRPLGTAQRTSEVKQNPHARFYVFDSSLSEYGRARFRIRLLGRSSNDQLVAWEAQFGDFSNGAQIIIDQYISVLRRQMAAEDAAW